MSIKKKLAHNTLYNALGRIWEALVNLGLTIYIVERLQFEGLGIWSLVAVFISYAALVDFGVGGAFVKYIAEYAAKKDSRRVSAVVSTGIVFYVFLAVLLIAVGWPLIGGIIEGIIRLMGWVHPEQAAYYRDSTTASELAFLFRGALLLFAVGNCMAPFSAVQTGLQRMGITNLLNGIASLIKIGATIFFLENGYGVPGLLYANGLALLLFGGASIGLAFYLYPALRVGPRYLDGTVLRQLFAFGWKTQVHKMANLLNYQVDRLLIGLFLADLRLIGVYRAAEELAQKFRQLPALLMTAMIPAVSELDAMEDHERLEQLYKLSSKYTLAVTIPLVLFFLLYANVLLHVLFGARAGLDTAAWVMRVLVIGYAISLLPGPGINIALGKGRAGLPMCAGLIALGSNIAMTAILLPAMGIYGAPLATALSCLIAALWFIWVVKHFMHTLRHTFLPAAMAWPLLASLPGSLIGLLLIVSPLAGGDRWSNLGLSILGALLCLGSYAVLLRWTPFLSDYDRRFLHDSLGLDRMPGMGILIRRHHHH